MPPQRHDKYASLIKSEAIRQGFDACGIAKAGFLNDEAPRLEEWLKNKHHAGMSYMEKHFDKRLDPSLLFEGAKTVISLVFNYTHTQSLHPESHYKLASYAQLYDYHFFLKSKMQAIVQALRKDIGDFEAAVFVDSAPVLERAWAIKSGLGIIGKNAQLYVPNCGARYFICQILTDLETAYDTPLTGDFCGNCRLCIDACPNKAILGNKTIDARKCISYITIEHKGPVGSELLKGADKSIFGCDICLDVCPLNKQHKYNPSTAQFVNTQMLDFKKEDWENMTKQQFKAVFKNTSLWRSGLGKIKHNMDLLKE